MKVNIDKYEYVNEETIDDQLKCIICTQPFRSPLVLSCRHSFCQSCIDTWMETNSSCPICRQLFSRNQLERRTTTAVEEQSQLNDRLDELVVRCLGCNKSNIKRSAFPRHCQRCPKSRLKLIVDVFRHRWQSVQKTIRMKNNRPVRTTSPATIFRLPRERIILPARQMPDERSSRSRPPTTSCEHEIANAYQIKMDMTCSSILLFPLLFCLLCHKQIVAFLKKSAICVLLFLAWLYFARRQAEHRRK